ncbi:MAG: RIO1 family regulatory kinase/ATPase [Candidatus Buchananbacteria bacterium]|nr:RIO1 family regulatory kinase/ATPase [Candidatus Buchananbacteria bacterium]
MAGASGKKKTVKYAKPKPKKMAKPKRGQRRNKVLKIKAASWEAKNFKELGRGGEAIIYTLKPGIVAKIFLKPDAPEFAEDPELREAAWVRIEEMQTKLFSFPKDLPAELVTPTGVLVNGRNRVFGYVMPFINGTSLDKLGRTNMNPTAKKTKKMLVSLYDTVVKLHEQGVIIGDFNENNIIVFRDIPYLIDADSMQFGPYQCRSFIPRFTAPEILRITNSDAGSGRKKKDIRQWSFAMATTYNELTDWYSYLVIAMRLLTFTDPYGGVAYDMDLAERMSQRITVFDQPVVYPLIAKPLSSVPRPILETFFKVFHLHKRFIPDKKIFDSLANN